MGSGRLGSIGWVTSLACWAVLLPGMARAPSPARGAPTATGSSRVFAPYIFMGLQNADLPAVSRAAGASVLALAFVVSSSSGCEAAWFDGHPLSGETTLAGEISSLRQSGGDVVISLGGANGTELAVGCPDAPALSAQYRAVIDKYSAARLDFDIEPPALGDSASVGRRNQVIARLQDSIPGLGISYTLPVTPEGLTDDGLRLLRNAQSHGVRVETVNLMTMDYGEPALANAMGKTAIAASNRALGQLKSIGIDTGLGITPMIGVNDTAPEVFTPADARTVLRFARSTRSVRLLSMWSVGRDRPCPSPGGAATPTCSGVAQQPYEFSHIFATFPGS